MRLVLRSYIQRAYRTEYIPGLTKESKILYETYMKLFVSSPFRSSTMESGTKLLDKMTDGKKRRWEEVITTNNMTHNSRKAWKTIRILFNDPVISIPTCLLSANQIAHQLLINGKCTMPSKLKHPVLSTVSEGTTSMVYHFSEEEYRRRVTLLKKNKSAGRDNVLVEQHRNIAHKWLLTMLNTCYMENKIITK